MSECEQNVRNYFWNLLLHSTIALVACGARRQLRLEPLSRFGEELPAEQRFASGVPTNETSDASSEFIAFWSSLDESR